MAAACASCAALQRQLDDLAARCMFLEAANARLARGGGTERATLSAHPLPTSTDHTGPSPTGQDALCGNCDRPVPTSALAMHTMHCSRHIAKCGACRRVLPVRDLPAHVAGERGTAETLRAAVLSGDAAVLLSASVHGADFAAAVDGGGETLVHVAARSLQAGVLRTLLEGHRGGAGGPPLANATNSAGETALHVLASTRLPSGEGRGAAVSACTSLVALLLSHGGGCDVRSLLGDTPLHVAQRSGFTELALLLARPSAVAWAMGQEQSTLADGGTLLGALPPPVARKAFAHAAPPSGVLEVHDYEKNIFGRRHAVCFFGPLGRVVLICDVASCPVTDLEAMTADPAPTLAALRLLEQLLHVYDSVVGHVPALHAPFHGRVRVEVGDIGAAGLAHHGRGGIAVGLAFLGCMVDGQRAGRKVLHQIFGYEFYRNYVTPDLTALFHYTCARGACGGGCRGGGGRSACTPHPDSWGWVNQGLVDIMGALVMDELPGVEYEYAGQDRDAFRAGMEADLAQYIGGGYTWSEVFGHDRTPWNPSRSTDNVYAGLLSVLYTNHGGVRFLRRFFAAVPVLSRGRVSGASSPHLAAGNLYLACSVGAGEDLADYFLGTLRWPVEPQRCAAILAYGLEACKGVGGPAAP